MESYNDLGQMYFSAVDSRDISLAAELLARVISKVNEDDRILNLFFKLKISEHLKDDVLAELNSKIWHDIKKWDAKHLTFDNWVLQNTQTIIRKHKTARNRSISTEMMLETEKQIKTRASEPQKRENPEVNCSDLFIIEINQVYLDELLGAFFFRFPQPFFHAKNNESICVSGIPVWNEDSEKTDYCIVVNYPEAMMFESIRKFKATIIAMQPSGKSKTLVITGSETIDASQIEHNSFCSLTIILEKPKVPTNVENAEDTSKLTNLEIEEALRNIFGKRQNAKLPLVDDRP